MARHRRYPTKKATKIKAKDSYERMSKDTGKNRKKNLVPKNEDIDDQAMPKKWLEIQETAKEAAQSKPKKKRCKNKFYELTAKMGFKRRPWENEERLAHRLMRRKNRDIDDELIKVQAGTAGRDAAELDADFKELDDKDRRKKLMKVAASEKRRKLREKEERFRDSQLARGNDFDFDMGDEEDVESVPSDDNDAHDSVDEDEPKANEAPKKLTRKQRIAALNPSDEPPKKRLTGNEKIRQKKKSATEEREKYLMLNAREVIPFGEVADGPPKFTSAYRKTLDPLFAQAGKKDLLLKSLLKPNNNTSTPPDDETANKRPKITEQDRIRVIQAYRDLRKQNNI